MTRREFHPPHGPRGCVAAHCSAAGGSRAEAATSLRRELRSRHIADKPLRRFHRKALSDAETLGASKPNGNVVPRHFEYALPIEPDAYDPAQAKTLLAEAGYPNGFDGGDLTPIPPYSGPAEVVANYLGGVGIRMKLRTMERAAFFSGFQGKKLKGVCFCTIAIFGNTSTRLSENVPSSGTYAYGGWPDVDELYRQQLNETDPAKRGGMLHQIQKLLHERTRFAPIYDYFWPSGVGPRVEEVSLMKIDAFPWAAPLEDLRLKPQ